MEAIIQFFSTIGEVIVSVVEFVINLFKDLIFVIQLIAKFLAQLPGYFSWIPSEIGSLLFVLFSIVAIYKILGREG